MDLSQNNLSGDIPVYFGTFESLCTLNLSLNNLEGPVPEGGVFANSSDVFIQGNKEVCVSSLVIQLPPCKELSSNRKKTSYIQSVMDPITTILIVTMACVAWGGEMGLRELLSTIHSNVLVNYHTMICTKQHMVSLQEVLLVQEHLGLYIKVNWSLVHATLQLTYLDLTKMEHPSSFYVECEALKSIRHRNLVRVIGLCSTFDTSGFEFKALFFAGMNSKHLFLSLDQMATLKSGSIQKCAVKAPQNC